MKKFYQFETRDFVPFRGVTNYLNRVLDRDNINREKSNMSLSEYEENIAARGIVMVAYHLILPAILLGTSAYGLVKLLTN